MYMQLYIKKDGERYILCDVDVHAVDYSDVKGTKKWFIEIKVYFGIKNCLEFTMNNPSRLLVEDLDSIQKIPQEYHDDKSKRFPQSRAYFLKDPQMNKDKAIIISEIRKQLWEIAERHELLYNED